MGKKLKMKLMRFSRKKSYTIKPKILVLWSIKNNILETFQMTERDFQEMKLSMISKIQKNMYILISPLLS